MDLSSWGQYIPTIIIAVVMGLSVFGVSKFGRKDDMAARVKGLMDEAIERDKRDVERDKQNAALRGEVSSIANSLRIAKNDIGDLERAQGERDAEIQKVSDMAYLMLQWIRTTIQDNAIPTEIPRDFIIFGEKYTGRFKY